jgi:glycosyltransferase involved in cell wall biosynthesis
MTSGVHALFVSHTGEVAGAERSLMDLLAGLPEGVTVTVACPDGMLADLLTDRGVSRVRLPGTDASFRLHPVHTTAGVAWVARTALRLRAIARRCGASLIHANMHRAGLAAGMAAKLGGPPAIVHLRDRLPSGRPARLTLGAIEAGADAVVANSSYIAGQLNPNRCTVRVIYNPVDSVRFDPERIDRDAARDRFGLEVGDVVMAVVAHLSPLKGQDDAVRLLARLKPSHPNLRLVLAGEAKFTGRGARFDSLQYERELRNLALSLGLQREVTFVGERNDVPELLRAADLLLVPSWHEGFGRSALEGMAMRLPVVATDVGGPAEILRDGVDGLLLAPRGPDRWATAIERLLRDPELRVEMGRQGRERALADFTLGRHVEQVVALYGEVLDSRR